MVRLVHEFGEMRITTGRLGPLMAILISCSVLLLSFLPFRLVGVHFIVLSHYGQSQLVFVPSVRADCKRRKNSNHKKKNRRPKNQCQQRIKGFYTGLVQLESSDFCTTRIISSEPRYVCYHASLSGGAGRVRHLELYYKTTAGNAYGRDHQVSEQSIGHCEHLDRGRYRIVPRPVCLASGIFYHKKSTEALLLHLVW